MPDRVPNIDPSTIAAVIEANINAYLLSFSLLPGATIHHDAAYTWVDSGYPIDSFNSILQARFSASGIDAGIASALSHFRERGREVVWHVGPSTEPADLGRYLLSNGMAHAEDEPGMAVEIERARAGVAAPAELVVEPVRDDAGLADWVAVWLFPVPDRIRRICLDALRQRGFGPDCAWRYYVGRIHGTPVATSELFIGAGVAAVHYVVTLPDLRRRGIGTAMTMHVLDEARAMGYRVGVLTASPDGIGVYRALGFREYCWFHRYALIS